MAVADFIAALDNTEEIQLGTVGRISGQEKSHPVWFVRHDTSVYLLPVAGSSSNWYKNLLHTPTLHLTAGGSGCDIRGRSITDATDVRRVVDDFRAKYGADQVAQYYPHPDVAVEARLA